MKKLEEKEKIRLIETLHQREQELAEREEELDSQKEELTAAIEQLILKNKDLSNALSDLKERNYELDEILYRSSHDLRSPLISIKGILQLMERENLSASMTEFTNHIAIQVEKMMGLSIALSGISSLDSKEVHFVDCDMADIISDCVRSFSSHANFALMDVAVQVDPSVKKVSSDPTLIMSILKPVIENAIIFRDSKKTGILQINVSRLNNVLQIEVKDDGAGLLPEVKNEVFKMFFKGSEQSEGHGLGLYIAKRILDRLNGHISIDSDGDFTKVEISIPLI